jgi:hypothetical protein
MNVPESTGSAQPKWFLELSTRFRDYALKQNDAQTMANAAQSEAKPAETASAARPNMGQTINSFVDPGASWFGQQTGSMPGNTGILNEIGQSIAYMKQLALEEKANAPKESVKPPMPEESYGHWQDGSAAADNGNRNQANLQDGIQYLDTATLHPIETADEDWATSGGLLHLDDDMMDFADAAGNVYSLGRGTLWGSDMYLPANVTIRIPLGPDGELPGKRIVAGVGMSEPGFSVRFYGGLEQPVKEYAKLYGETLKKYKSGEIDSNEFDRRIGIMDQYFDKVAKNEQRWLRSTVSLFSEAMRVRDPEFFDARTDTDVNAFLSDVGRMYDNIRNHIKSGGDIAGLTKDIIEAGCDVSGLDDVKFLHSDKFWNDYMTPAMKALEAEKKLMFTNMADKISAKWVEEHAKAWVDLNTGSDAEALGKHLKNLLLKLVNYGNDDRPGSFLQQLSYDRTGQ